MKRFLNQWCLPTLAVTQGLCHLLHEPFVVVERGVEAELVPLLVGNPKTSRGRKSAAKLVVKLSVEKFRPNLKVSSFGFQSIFGPGQDHNLDHCHSLEYSQARCKNILR